MNDIIAELAVKAIETENMLQSNIVTIFFGIRRFFEANAITVLIIFSIKKVPTVVRSAFPSYAWWALSITV